MSEQVQGLIAAECDRIKEMLLGKNRAYGNSALEPMRVFSKASADEQIRVRLDDKLSRLARGSGIETEDVEADIIGYLVLMRVYRRMAVVEEPIETQADCPANARIGKVVGLANGHVVRVKYADADETCAYSVGPIDYAVARQSHGNDSALAVWRDDNEWKVLEVKYGS